MGGATACVVNASPSVPSERLSRHSITTPAKPISSQSPRSSLLLSVHTSLQVSAHTGLAVACSSLGAALSGGGWVSSPPQAINAFSSFVLSPILSSSACFSFTSSLPVLLAVDAPFFLAALLFSAFEESRVAPCAPWSSLLFAALAALSACCLTKLSSSSFWNLWTCSFVALHSPPPAFGQFFFPQNLHKPCVFTYQNSILLMVRGFRSGHSALEWLAPLPHL